MASKLPKKYFTKFKKPLVDLPNLIEFQKDSFKWFREKGLKELFEDISPIKDFTEKELELHFIDYSIGEPNYDDQYAKDHNLSYEAPLKTRFSLVNKRTKEKKEQEVFFGNIFLMTERGTFVINGVERVLISQLARSFGVYFNSVFYRGKNYFGAKIIPSRGSWIEIQTEPNGVIYARIDRKRKFLVTSLLRFFNLEKDQDIKECFKERDRGEIKFIDETIKEDPAKSQSEGIAEMYSKIRPGEPASPEAAKEFISKMFSKERYDLSLAGRHRLNRRLGLPLEGIEKMPRNLNLEDLKAVVAKIIELNNNPEAVPDDIDHLGNRRVRGVGEMFQQRLRIAMIKIRAIIQDRMAALEKEGLAPLQLVNPRPFIIAMREFFLTGQLSQFMSQENILSEVEHLRRLSALGPGGLSRERAGIEARDVHSSHYNRICPIQTPEGQNVGLVVNLAIFARVNEFGILETPYLKVDKGRITSEVKYLDAFEEENYSIAAASTKYDEKGKILEELIESRVKGKPAVIHKDEIDFIDVSPQQAFSISTSLIPFLEHDDASRALMGANMQRQAIPCLRPEAPLVATGLEEKAALDSGRLVRAPEEGVIKYADAQKIIFQSKKEEKIYNLLNFHRSNDFTLVHQRPIVSPGQKVNKGDVLNDCASTQNGELALGKNVFVAFLSLAGSTYEDSIVISEKLVRADTYTSVHIEDHICDVRETKLGPEITTYDIPNVSEERLKNLDEDGIVRIGAEVRANDILVGKLSPKGEIELTPEEKLLRAIFGEKAKQFKDTSYRLPHGKEGRVIGIKIFSWDKGDKLEPGITKRIQIEVAQLRKLEIGDKISGRHGNKGVVSKILKEEDMPFLEDGRPIDIVLNPLGVISRMNLGQILETHLGLAAKTLNYQAISPIFQGVSEEEIKEELLKAGYPSSGQLKIYDGRTGELIENNVTVGHIYMLKLKHMVTEKIHMRSIGPYSLITQQPLGGKAQMGGQRFGEMEVWALEAYGAAHTLQEMLTVKSDDVAGRIAVHEAIIRGEKFKNPSLPASFNVLLNELKGLSLDVKLIKKDN